MARIRSVHPGLFTDEAFVTCSAFARLLAIGLWTEADDQGVFEWKPVAIKMRVFPADSVDTAALLEELVTANLICKFQSGGKNYGAVRNFRRFQRPKKPNSIHPLPDELRTYVALSGVSSEQDDDDEMPVTQKVEKSPQMEDVGGRREEEDEESKKIFRASFDRFWQRYPHKVGELKAREAFRPIASEIEAILEGTSRYIASKPPGREWLNPATFLADGRWRDLPASPPSSGKSDGKYTLADAAAREAERAWRAQHPRVAP